MAKKATGVGAVLIVLGIVVTVLSDSGSVTSLIPAFIGLLFVGLGLAARFRPAMSHHLMHAAAALALLGILGSLGSLIGRGSTGWALFSQLVTVVVLGFFLQQAVLSFRAARQARVAAEG
ncbi:MAG: hypothetical protein AAGA65_17340 [Actinomycetota bacterium]